MRWLLFVLFALALVGAPARAGLPELVAATKPSVVAVGVFNATANPRFGFRGTGFAIGDGRLIVTNAHVLPADDDPNADRLAIAVPRDRTSAEVRTARRLSVSTQHDLVLLQIDGAPLPPLTLAGPQTVREGMAIALIGFPLGSALGLVPVTHAGVVSAITAIALPAPTSRQLDARTATALRQGPAEIYQLDATAYPGNSGSPVLDLDSGKVIGVINSVFVKGTKESAISQPTGISYAVPGRYVVDLMGTR